MDLPNSASTRDAIPDAIEEGPDKLQDAGELR